MGEAGPESGDVEADERCMQCGAEHQRVIVFATDSQVDFSYVCGECLKQAYERFFGDNGHTY